MVKRTRLLTICHFIGRPIISGVEKHMVFKGFWYCNSFIHGMARPSRGMFYRAPLHCLAKVFSWFLLKH